MHADQIHLNLSQTKHIINNFKETKNDSMDMFFRDRTCEAYIYV